MLLKRLLRNNCQKYSSLTQGYSSEDNIVFHLKQLLANGFIEKHDGRYELTTEGTKEITKYDLELMEDLGFKTFFVGFICKSGNEYLIREHPTSKVNFYNLPSGKPHFGENIEKALVRIFYENTDIKVKSTDFKYLTLHLKTIKTSKNEVLFDDASAVYKVLIDKTTKAKMKLHKSLKWIVEDKIKRLPNRWPEIDICINQKNVKPYLSYEFVSNYLL